MSKPTTLLDRIEDRGVSPVIGVILMVAITVILAAVIGSFVMNLGGSVNQNAQVGVTFEEKSNGDVEITVNSAPRVDSLDFSAPSGAPGPDSDVAAGDTYTWDSPNDGDTIRVIGTYQGEDSVVATHTYSG